MMETEMESSLRKRACIITYGCQMNRYDSDVMAGVLRGEGYVLEGSPEGADLVLVNTCSVRAHAESRALNTIRYLAGLKTKRPNMKIGVCGCMAERCGSSLFREGVDVVLGPSNLKKLPSILRLLDGGKTRIIETGGVRVPHEEGEPFPHSRISAFLPISFGCNSFCSYCIVPFVRGRQRSRRVDEVVEEARRLILNGTRELTILGQQVNAYGEDLNGEGDLSTLLRALDRIDGLFWMRFITAHPAKMKPELIDAMSSLGKVCEHIHLPLQSGSNRILKRMRRGYTLEEYMEIVEDLRRSIPHLAITTDIIVGFPGEDEEDFEETLRAIRLIGFDGAFTFRYSPRPGTKAASFVDDVHEEVKKERLSRLIDLQGMITEEKNRELVGNIEEVLVLERNPKGEGLLGRTRTNKVVLLDGEGEMVGAFLKVKITKGGRWHLNGRRIKECNSGS
jgi:tRNA-2-methylthio-N6-dimethylallyladenosine synthase